jgi:hypothetical protein
MMDNLIEADPLPNNDSTKVDTSVANNLLFAMDPLLPCSPRDDDVLNGTSPTSRHHDEMVQMLKTEMKKLEENLYTAGQIGRSLLEDNTQLKEQLHTVLKDSTKQVEVCVKPKINNIFWICFFK